jgi:hypothetical protein
VVQHDAVSSDVGGYSTTPGLRMYVDTVIQHSTRSSVAGTTEIHFVVTYALTSIYTHKIPIAHLPT